MTFYVLRPKEIVIPGRILIAVLIGLNLWHSLHDQRAVVSADAYL